MNADMIFAAATLFFILSITSVLYLAARDDMKIMQEARQIADTHNAKVTIVLTPTLKHRLVIGSGVIEPREITIVTVCPKLRDDLQSEVPKVVVKV